MRAFSFPFIFVFGGEGFFLSFYLFLEVRVFSFPFIFVFGEDGFLLFLFYFFEVRVVAEAREVVKHLEGLLGGEDEVLVKMDDFFDLP